MPSADARRLLIVIAAGVIALAPAWVWGIPGGADLDNHFRFVQPFFDELSRGNFVPAWLAESNDGFGDPRFRFYPPLIYYVLSAARAITGEWYWATLLVFTLFSVLGTVGSYVLARTMLSRNAAVIAGCLFAFMPYHLTQFYQASLLAEFAATSLLPFAFLFVHRAITGTRKLPAVGGLGLAFAALVLTHLPTAVIGSLSLGLFAIVLSFFARKPIGLAFAAGGVLLGLMASSWFWIRMVAELGWIQAGTGPISTYYDYRNNFLFSPFSQSHLNVWYGGLVAAMTLGLALPFAVNLGVLFRRSGQPSDLPLAMPSENGRSILRTIVLVAGASLLMTTDISRPLWAIVPGLPHIQFPYRWLLVTSVMVAPLAGFAITDWAGRLRRREIRPFHLPLLLAFAAAHFYSIPELVVDSTYLDRNAFTARLSAIRGGPSFRDWLPAGAAELKDIERTYGNIDPQGRTLFSERIDSHSREFHFSSGEAAAMRIRTYFYQLWKATDTASGAPLATRPASDGTLIVDVPPATASIGIKFTEPGRTACTYALSLIGAILSLGAALTAFSPRNMRDSVQPC